MIVLEFAYLAGFAFLAYWLAVDNKPNAVWKANRDYYSSPPWIVHALGVVVCVFWPVVVVLAAAKNRK